MNERGEIKESDYSGEAEVRKSERGEKRDNLKREREVKEQV